MHAKKKTPGLGAPAYEGWSFVPESHQSKRTSIVGNPENGGKARPAGVSESLTEAQCKAMRAAALRFRYVLTWAIVPGAGLRWYARRDGAAPVVLGNTAAVHRFLTMHSRWIEHSGLGQAKADRWLAQKTRSQVKRLLRRREATGTRLQVPRRAAAA